MLLTPSPKRLHLEHLPSVPTVVKVWQRTTSLSAEEGSDSIRKIVKFDLGSRYALNSVSYTSILHNNTYGILKERSAIPVGL